MVWPALIGAAATIGGAILSSDAARKNANIQQDAARENIQLQREFAQMGLRWKVNDAKAAGLHPLAAIGAQTQSFNPVQVGSTYDPTGEILARGGQDVARAMTAGASAPERRVAELQIKNAELDLKIKEANYVRTLRDMYSTPPVPGIGKTGDPVADAMNSMGQTPLVQMNPDPLTPSKQMGVSAATSPLMKHYIDDHGWIWNVLNQEAAESVESDNTAQTKMMIHNGLKWIAGSNEKVKPDVPVPPGWKLIYSRPMDQWRLVRATHEVYRGKIHQGSGTVTPYEPKSRPPLKQRNIKNPFRPVY